MYRRTFNEVCRRILVSVPAKYKANVPVKMSDDGDLHPPSDWAIEPHRLELGVIVARTLFSDRTFGNCPTNGMDGTSRTVLNFEDNSKTKICGFVLELSWLGRSRQLHVVLIELRKQKKTVV